MIHKPLLISLGLFFVALGILGIFLPLLPTTPFLLLALACFAESSEKLHNWLINNKTFGPLIRQWQETRSMPRKAKIIAFITIITGGVISILSVETDLAKIIIGAVLLIPMAIILKIKSTESLK